MTVTSETKKKTFIELDLLDQYTNDDLAIRFKLPDGEVIEMTFRELAVGLAFVRKLAQTTEPTP